MNRLVAIVVLVDMLAGPAVAQEWLAIWTLGIFGPATRWRTLPSDREWCAIELNREAGFEPCWALSCNGEIWALSDPPQYVATFASPPTAAQPTCWGWVKGKFQ